MRGGHKPAEGHIRARPALDALLPILVSVLLCAPVLGIGYIWDDYDFLTGAQSDPTRFLRPLPGVTFFRPISQGLYFLVLLILGKAGSAAGHVLNLALVALVIFLLTRLGSRLAGRMAGLGAGLAFAALAPIPTLVAWVSCAQDLLAMAFFLGALLAVDSGRNVLAAALALAALLSKETVMALLPLLVAWNWIRGRPPRIAGQALRFGIPALGWMAIHPGLRALFGRSLRSGATGYVGLEHPERWAGYAVKYLATLVNLPVTGPSTLWPVDRTAVAVAAIAVTALAFFAGWIPPQPQRGRSSMARVVTIGALIALPTLLLTVIFVRLWNPYFAAMPALGSSLVLGVWLARMPRDAAAAAVAGFIVLGTWCRGIEVPGGLSYTEQDMVAADRAARHLDGVFHALHPEFPRGSRLLVSITTTGTLGIQGTLIHNQAARIWYGDPTLMTELPQQWDGGKPAFLFRVMPGLDVAEIDLDRPVFHTASGLQPPPDEVGRTVRSFARGVAARGDRDRAVKILERLAASDQEPLRGYDRRLAAMILLQEGDRAAAESLLALCPEMPRVYALNAVSKVYEEPAGGEFDPALRDTTAFPAFGFSSTDPEVIRELLRRFVGSGYPEQAAAFARRLDRLAPGDPEAAAVLRHR